MVHYKMDGKDVIGQGKNFVRSVFAGRKVSGRVTGSVAGRLNLKSDEFKSDFGGGTLFQNKGNCPTCTVIQG